MTAQIPASTAAQTEHFVIARSREEMAAAQDPRCDGTCKPGCPVPTQEPCPGLPIGGQR